jgi:hypothetical protein
VYLKQLEVHQRECPIPHVRDAADFNKNLLIDVLDFSRHHVVEDKYGNIRAPSPFTLSDLQSQYDHKYKFPFLTGLENKVLSLFYRADDPLSYKRIALALKITTGEVKIVMERALRKLARNLDHDFFKRQRAERERLAKKAAANIEGYSSHEIQWLIKKEIREKKELTGGRRRPRAGAWPDKEKQGVDSESLAKSDKWRDKL